MDLGFWLCGDWDMPEIEDRYYIHGPDLYHGAIRLGPTNLLYCDSKELEGVGEAEGVIHRQMPNRVDMVMVGNGVVVGVESKTPQDLLNSYLNRRLKRQCRTLLAVVDLPVLLIRGAWPDFLYTRDKNGNSVVWSTYDSPSRDGPRFHSLHPLLAELARWQMLGGMVLFGPPVDRPQSTAAFLLGQRHILGGTRNVLVAVAGRDKTKVRNEDSFGRLLRAIPGIGEATVQRLTKEGERKVWQVLNASDEEFREWGVRAGIVRKIKEAMER